MSNQDDREKKLAAQYWNLRSVVLPHSLDRVPTMLTDEERRMLVWLAMHYSRGNGEIVDLGSFLGGSTAHLLQGTLLSGFKKVVHAYDQFKIKEEQKDHWLYSKGYSEFLGEDMECAFNEVTSPFGDTIIHKGQMVDLKWTGEPIEILFVDICKDWETMRHVMREFYPHLVPGKSVIIQQDYQHWMHPWVVATCEALSAQMEMMAWTQENSVIFSCQSFISIDIVEEAIANTDTYTKTRDLIDRASKRFPYARQREAVWHSIMALDRNPHAKTAYELSLE